MILIINLSKNQNSIKGMSKEDHRPKGIILEIIRENFLEINDVIIVNANIKFLNISKILRNSKNMICLMWSWRMGKCHFLWESVIFWPEVYRKWPFHKRKQNSAAALSFLAELKDRKREPEEKSFDPDNDKIQFNRPKSNKIKTNQENAESSSSKTKVGGGILLDEYVVGMAKPRVPKYRSKGRFVSI